MALYLVTDLDLIAIANAIRTKGGTSAELEFPDEFVTAIDNISGGGGTPRTSSDLTVSGATVTAPAGVYASDASKSVATMTLPTTTSSSATSGYTSKATLDRSTSDRYINIGPGYNSAGGYYKISKVANGSATTPATTISVTPTVSLNSATGVVTGSVSASQSITPTISAGYVSSGTAGTVSVSGSANIQLVTQAAQTIHPSTSDQTISQYQYLTGNQTIKAVTMTNLTAANIKKDVVVKIGDSTDDDCVTSITGTYEGSGGSSKNIQYSMGRDEVSATSYTATNRSITVSKAGTYKCYWVMDRNTTSGTSGSQLYKNGSAVGSAHTSWTYNSNNRYGMNCEETLTLAKNDVLVVRCRSRSTSYICGAENLIIVEQ